MTPHSTASTNATGLPLLAAKPPFTVTTSLAGDWQVAAVGGMTSIVVLHLSYIVNLPLPLLYLIQGGQIALGWGLLQLGRSYGLRWTSRGAALLMVANLTVWLGVWSLGSLSTLSRWLTAPVAAIGIILAFVDLWALRQQLGRTLVSAVVAGYVGGRFFSAMELLSTSQSDLLDAVNVGLLAWLFYEAGAQQTSVVIPSLPENAASA